jgi:subtilisin family serine protease
MKAESHARQTHPRRSIFTVLITSIAIAGSSFTSPAKALDSTPADDSWQAAAEAVSATPAELRDEVSDGSLKLVVVRDVDGLPVIETTFLDSKVDLEETLNRLNSDPSVVSVEPESQVRAFSTPPYFTSQWGITTVASESVSATTQGAGIVVAVVDSGVNANNPDLAGRVMDGVDYRDGFSYLNSSGLIDNCVSYTDARYFGRPVHADYGKYDPNGHGTHVAGVISSNGIGVKSVAPQATIMPVRVLSSSGSGDVSDVACGVIYAANNGAHVINMSLGADEDSPSLRAAVSYAISKDVVVVAASGNDGTTGVNTYPAALPDVIGVGAISNNSEQSIAYFSNQGNYVDVVAPGVGIWSTCSSPSEDCSTSDGDSNYESLSGTSMATPFVAGLAALILSLDQDLRFSDVASIITSSAIDKGTPGYDQVFGFGLINAPAAITKTREMSAIYAQQVRDEQIAAAAVKAAADKAAADKAAADKAAADKAAADKAAADKAAADKAAADKAAADKAAADKAAAIKLAAEQKAAALSKISKSLKIKVLTSKRISISVTTPVGSKTVIQRKVGGVWKTLSTVSAVKNRVVTVRSSGTYRVQIKSTTGTVTSKTYRLK